MKRVLVTGACGNIGAHVVDLLVQRGYAVRAIDLDTPAGRKVSARWDADVDMRFGSICNDALVRETVAGMDHVIHLAAMIPPNTRTPRPEVACTIMESKPMPAANAVTVPRANPSQVDRSPPRGATALP